VLEFFKSLEQSPISLWVRESGSVWSFPTILLLHTLGMSIVAGGSAIMDLALLGFWPLKAPVKPLDKYFPLIWAGFWLNLVTGSLMLMADATSKLTNPDFFVKMAFVAAGLVLLYVMRKKVFGDPQLDQVPPSRMTKGLAWASLICWFGAIMAGRLLAYVGPASGPPGFSNP
jgi:hypothetical protein